MKVSGFFRSNFIPKGSDREITGYRVHLLYPATGAEAAGFVGQDIYLSDRVLTLSNYALNVDDEIEVFYNSRGKVSYIRHIHT